MADLMQQLNDELADVVGSVRRSLVHVSNGGLSHGAGIIVRPDGLILTNAHVVQHRTLQVTLADGETLAARLVAYDTERDLAALKVDAHDLPSMELGDSTELHPGQWVLALGHPWGIPGAVSSGVVIGGGGFAADRPSSGREWLAVNLNLRPGNSGGPLVDVQGRLLGINTVMAGAEVGLAVPVQAVREFLAENKSLLGRFHDVAPGPDQPQTGNPPII